MAGLVNPLFQIRKPKFPKGRDRRLLSGEEEVLLTGCRAYGGEIEKIVRLVLKTGMRRTELSEMTWDTVDLKRRTVTLPETTNGEKRIVPLSTEAVRILTDLPRRIDGGVWNLTTPHAISIAFSRVTDLARKTYENDCAKKGRKPDPAFLVDLTFHDLRHEATSRFFEKGFNLIGCSPLPGTRRFRCSNGTPT